MRRIMMIVCLLLPVCAPVVAEHHEEAGSVYSATLEPADARGDAGADR